MAMYQKGEFKRDGILSAARQLFYEKGFENTTIREISDRSDTPVGLINYYFKKKQDLARAIYLDFHNAIDVFLYSHMPALEEDIFLTHCLNNRIYYAIILGDPHNSRLYLEMMKSKSNAKLIAGYAENIYHKYPAQYGVAVTEEELKTYIAMNFGARREFFLEFFGGRLGLDIQTGVGIILGFFPRLLRVEHKTIDDTVARSMELFEALDYSGIKFLI